MGNKKKVFLSLAGLGLVVLGLSSCTNTFCSNQDRARMMYAFDVYTNKDHVLKEGEDINSGLYSYGISTYYDSVGKPEDAEQIVGYPNIYVTYNIETNKSLVAMNQAFASDENNEIRVNDYKKFWSYLDNAFLNQSVEQSGFADSKESLTVTDIKVVLIGDETNNVGGFGYTKFLGYDDNVDTFWHSWNIVLNDAREELGADYVPDLDYVNKYQSTMSGYVAQFNSCLATTDGFYGYYGYESGDQVPVFVSGKSWDYAWSRGFLEGLIIFPIGWLIDNITTTFLGNGVAGGWAQILSILLVTIIIRAILMLVTINQTLSNAKMSEVQPEIARIQAKYPNANTNASERNAMTQETQAIYKKHKIHPFLSMLVLVVQFPVFICVWGAMSGSAVLASNDVFGLRLSDSVQNAVFSGSSGWAIAVIMFVLMAALQTVSMLLPQWINKRKARDIAKTGRNPNVKSQGNKMKWFTIIMLVFMIFMGFSLASGMVVYWIAGSIWAIAQTLIIELINHIRKNNKKNKGKRVKISADGAAVIDAEIVPEHMQAPTGRKKFKSKKEGN
ncbi:MAG: membrane protein insertase YidC [Erysipelotrichaceae bacterium]|jgi:YidC/Oxa1 family membrane protein insertase|nr:membrane protein insertase YidC [Erysipelotrichaceae bacterium]